MGDSLTVHSRQKDTRQGKTRAVPLLIVTPSGALIFTVALYAILSPQIPSHIARHVGPDGVGYSPTVVVMSIIFAASAVVFTIGGFLARGFFRDGHWFSIQKAVAAGTVALGYGILGIALATTLSSAGVKADDVSGNSVAMGMLGFLLMFTAAVTTYAALLPRAQPEPLV